MRVSGRRLLSGLFLGVIMIGLAGCVPKAEFFVAPDGSDAWSGKLPKPNANRTDGPFATLDGARRAVRKARQGRTPVQPTVVLVRGGTYRIAQPLVFTSPYSGTEAAPIVYAAYPGDRPIIDGGGQTVRFRPGDTASKQTEVMGTCG